MNKAQCSTATRAVLLGNPNRTVLKETYSFLHVAHWPQTL